MSSLDLEIDGRMDDLELRWREARDACVIAHAEYLALAANAEENADAIDAAKERRRRAEVRAARIFGKIELLEDSLLGLS